MYHVLIAAFLLLTVTEPAHAGQRQDIFRHAKAATVLIVGVNDASHSLSLGSGFFVDASGLLVTNAHVIEESARLYVYVLDREIYAAPDVVAVDPDLDLAVLRVPNTWVDPLTLAADSTPEGTEVIAVGYPRITDILQMGFALHASTIPAMVSGLVQGQSRTNGRVVDFLQAAGLLNFGSSGGPLVRTDSGEVAAMVVTTVPYLERAKDPQGVAIGSVMMKSGISYSIPAPAIRQWLAANHLSPSPLARAQQPLPNMAEPEANRSFATGYLLQTIAMVLHGDADLLKLAIRHYCVAAELRPDAPWIVRNLGLAYASLEQWDKAVQAYSKAMALAPDDSELRTDAAVAQQRSGRAEEAPALYQAALNTVDPAAEKGRVHSKMQGAITRLKSATPVDLVGKLNGDSAK
jgi:Trypsin-like peptidase domain/Tetratricopeptide repeat